jgi:SAM-dependent methyltransferase
MEERFYAEYARIQDQHWWFVGRREIIRAVLRRELGDAGSGECRILDVGCGTGTNLGLLRDFGAVEGVDPEAAAVEFCHGRGERRVRQAAGSDLPYEDDRFDLITLLDVIEHAPDDQVLLSEARRVLAPGGRVLVTVPAYAWMWGDQDRIAHHYRRYTRPLLVESLSQAGLEPLRSSYFNTLLFPPIALVRLARRLRPERNEASSDFELNRPGALNSLLARIFSLEASVVPRRPLPFGVSLLGWAAHRASPGPVS